MGNNEIFNPNDMPLAPRSNSRAATREALNEKVHALTVSTQQLTKLMGEYSEVLETHRGPSNPLEWLITPIDAPKERRRATAKAEGRLAAAWGYHNGLLTGIVEDLEHLGRDTSSMVGKIEASRKEYHDKRGVGAKDFLAYIGLILALVHSELPHLDS